MSEIKIQVGRRLAEGGKEEEEEEEEEREYHASKGKSLQKLFVFGSSADLVQFLHL